MGGCLGTVAQRPLSTKTSVRQDLSPLKCPGSSSSLSPFLRGRFLFAGPFSPAASAPRLLFFAPVPRHVKPFSPGPPSAEIPAPPNLNFQRPPRPGLFCSSPPHLDPPPASLRDRFRGHLIFPFLASICSCLNRPFFPRLSDFLSPASLRDFSCRLRGGCFPLSSGGFLLSQLRLFLLQLALFRLKLWG